MTSTTMQPCNHEILFKNYLLNRKQFVSIENFNSKLLSILISVPQGSILGPLLFLIYINDLPLHSNLLSYLFADDTALSNSSSNLDELFTTANTNTRTERLMTERLT